KIDIKNASANTIALVTSRLRLKRMRMLFQAISIALESGSVICRCTVCMETIFHHGDHGEHGAGNNSILDPIIRILCSVSTLSALRDLRGNILLKLPLEHALAHEDQSQRQHHDQTDPAAIPGEEDDDIELPLVAEFLREIVSAQQGADELGYDRIRHALIQPANDPVKKQHRQAEARQTQVDQQRDRQRDQEHLWMKGLRKLSPRAPRERAAVDQRLPAGREFPPFFGIWKRR